MKTDQSNHAWRLLEAGKEFKRRIGLYDTVRRNTRFYRGDQWRTSGDNLPRPVFNLVRRVVDFLVGSVAPGEISIQYTDERLPFLDTAAVRERIHHGLSCLNRNAIYRWKKSHMDALSQRALLDAALSGDGIFYCRWDDSCSCGQPFCGDIRTEVIPNTSFFPADPGLADIQEQDYILITGTATVTTLRAEAMEAGLSEREIAKILPDEEDDSQSLASNPSEKATYLLLFYRENGQVVFEKWTREVMIRRAETGLKYYPFAYFNWLPTSDCFHGTSPVSEILPNQVYINSAYGMAMKHMSDTAFSKIIYDKSRIPEWSNEVGEAIAAMGGGSVSDAVSVVGVGELQEGYLDLIESVIENTKEMMGATESALGDEQASNTSAILALQEASRITLRQVEERFARCIGELAAVWADMLCAYSPTERLLPVPEDGTVRAKRVDYALLHQELLHATAQMTNSTRLTPSATVSILDRLLEAGHLTVTQYIEHLPDGCVVDRDALLQSVKEKGEGLTNV